MTARVAIHGFGRTGRQAFKAIWRNHLDRLEIAAIGVEDEDDVPAAAHLLQYDSNYGRFEERVEVRNSTLHVGSAEIPIVTAKQLAGLPWGSLSIGIVIEATGVYVDGRVAEGHLEAGAEKVIITAPTDDADLQIIYGVNHDAYDERRHHLISSGSDTTNALAPLLQVMGSSFDVRNAMMTAIRAYTNAQKLLDSNDVDLRRARSAPTSIVPTSSRAVAAIGSVMPEIGGRLSGYAVRVPVPTVSILELTAQLGEPATAEHINAAFRAAAAERPLAGILGVSDEPLVSMDYRQDTRSAVVDAPLTITIGNLCKVSAWYDNEWGYSSRVADVAAFLANGAGKRTNGRAAGRPAEAAS